MFRKLYHIGGLLFPLLLALGLKRVAVYVSGILFIIILIFDMFRLQWKELNLLIIRKLPIKLKRKEVKSLTGSPFFLGGCFLTVLFFRPEYAMAGIIYLSIGDMLAVTVGRRIGRVRIFKKTLEGTLAFAISTSIFIILLKTAGIRYISTLSYFQIITGSVVCAVVEVLPIKIDDNLTIPIVGAALLQFLG